MIGKSGNAARPASARKPVRPSPERFARWRAVTLASVYLLFVVHVVHWKITGRTLAPLELNEVMYTLELGIVTAGFLFMAAALIATLIFGRFFCSWGCHILALEDAAAWLLTKLGIHPKPVRSRVLRWVPFIAMFYMFLWPQISRIAQGRALPALHLRTDAEGWASFMTSNFWRNLPGPGITLLTFVVCGFVMVYVLGTRAFCTYGCPYGAIFRIMDRFAPGRIVARGNCAGCGKCTAACQSHVRVHRELIAFGRVVDPACLKDLDCVAACPEGNVAFGFTKPSILTIGATETPRKLPYDFTPLEDAGMAVIFLASLFIFRGLYGTVPFLLTLAVGGILAYVTIVLFRLPRRKHVQINNFHLRIQNQLTNSGRVFVLLCTLLFAFTIHSAFIRYHEIRGGQDFEEAHRAGNTESPAQLNSIRNSAIHHLEFCTRWGLWRRDDVAPRLAELHASLGETLADEGEFAAAVIHLDQSIELVPDNAHTHYNMAVMKSMIGSPAEAIAEYRRTLDLAPNDADAHNNLGLLLAFADDLPNARVHFEQAIKINPDAASAHFNLGRLCQAQNRWNEARRCYATAIRLDPGYADAINELMGHGATGGAAHDRRE